MAICRKASVRKTVTATSHGYNFVFHTIVWRCRESDKVALLWQMLRTLWDGDTHFKGLCPKDGGATKP